MLIIISCIFDDNTIIFSNSLIVCEDTDYIGILKWNVYDMYGDSCLWYYNNANECGNYDDDDFTSNTMCCACNGGQWSKQYGKHNKNENKI